MVVVTLKHLNEAAARFADARSEIAAWYSVAREARWKGFIDVLHTMPDADAVDGYVIFNIRRNRYRLVTGVHYARQKGDRVTMGHVYIRSFLTHKQYDKRSNWDREYSR